MDTRTIICAKISRVLKWSIEQKLKVNKMQYNVVKNYLVEKHTGISVFSRKIQTIHAMHLFLTGPAKEKVYGDFLDFVKSEEKAFSKVQDFKKEEFEEKQKGLEINSKLEAIQEEQRRVEAMMVEEMEAHQQQAMELNKEYNERIDKMKDEEK